MRAELKRRLLLYRWWIQHFDRHQLRRWVYKLTRPPSYPYISGDGFRRLADHVQDETLRRISAKRVREGDLVFVSTYYIRQFFREVDPKIDACYRIITHNSDLPIDTEAADLISGKVLAWFAQNAMRAHPRIVPIPIGIENLHHYHAGIPAQFDAVRSMNQPKKTKILAAFAIQTNVAERQAAYDRTSELPVIERLPEWLGQLEYLQALSTYKYVLAPPGNGLDTHRAWEAMYLGVVPIVKESCATKSFEARGLPLWTVRDWEELYSVTDGQLERRYEELRPGFESPALFMDYWKDLVRGTAGVRDPGATPDLQRKLNA